MSIRRLIVPFFAVAGLALIPWTIWLTLSLPAHHETENWKTAWVGFDLAQAAALIATAATALRGSPWLAPVGALVPVALRAVRKAGVVVCAGIHMSDIPVFPYELLWGERVIRSVANLTRRDGEEFLALAPQVPVRTEVEAFELEEANEALDHLRSGGIRGAAVLDVGTGAAGRDGS